MGQLMTGTHVDEEELLQLLPLLENRVCVACYRRGAPRSVALLLRSIVASLPLQVAVATFQVHNSAQPWKCAAAGDEAHPPQPHSKVLTRAQLQTLLNLLRALKECLERGTNDHDRLTYGREQDVDRECQVCMDSKVQVVLQCTHGFCQHCLDEWREQNATCPLCRAEVGERQIQESWVIESWEQKDLHQNAEQIQAHIFQLLTQAPDAADDFLANYLLQGQQEIDGEAEGDGEAKDES